MRRLRSYILIGWFLARHAVATTLGRLGPTAADEDLYVAIMDVVDPFVGFYKHMYVRGESMCPSDHPTIVCGNHIKLDDPILAFRAVWLATDAKVRVRAMTRDDFFEGGILKTRFFDMDDVLVGIGTYPVSRGGVRLSQLKTFLGFLADGLSFLMYPGHTRSRSGLFMDYRGDFQEPGGVSFFLHQTQRRHPDVKVSATPLVRTFNPVTKRSAMVFGPERFLEKDATREQQRDFDYGLMEAMSQCLEVNVAQVLSGIIYLYALHKLPSEIAVGELEDAVRSVFDRCEHPYIDPDAESDLPKAVRLTLRYLQKHGMLGFSGETVNLNTRRILRAPEQDETYRKQNPVKFLMNQILHLGSVTELIEGVVLLNARGQEIGV